jgi:uncharacterized membrane protein
MKRFRAFIRVILSARWLSNRVLLFKSILYRGFSVMMTFIFSFIVTDNLEMSVGISLFDIIFKTSLYFIFEINWNNLIKRM